MKEFLSLQEFLEVLLLFLSRQELLLKSLPFGFALFAPFFHFLSSVNCHICNIALRVESRPGLLPDLRSSLGEGRAFLKTLSICGVRSGQIVEFVR